MYPNCLLFAKPEYPFPAMGSVHVSNYTKIYRAMPVGEEYATAIKVGCVASMCEIGWQEAAAVGVASVASRRVVGLFSSSCSFLSGHSCA